MLIDRLSSPYERQAVLEHCVTRFRQRYDELANSLCIEAGKPINDAEGEVTRLIDTFKIAAEESTRMYGEILPLDISPRAKGYRGMWKPVPIGPCSFISPFNFPLNLAAHKVAPALAVGCPFVLKPVVLELGGNAAVIVDEDTDIVDAVNRVVFGAFYQSGQSCIGVQRIFIHEKIYDEFRDALVTQTKPLKMGDPKDRETFIGPMISEKEVSRLKSWIDDAVNKGATLLCGGGLQGAMLEATLPKDVPETCEANTEEAFGPLANLASFSDFDEALAAVNRSQFGLQAGVFTRDIYKIQKAWDTLEVGGVIIGDVPSWRVDHMPYGGVKESGLGREGIRFAMRDMTETRLLVIREP